MKQFKCCSFNKVYTAEKVDALFPMSAPDVLRLGVGEEIVDCDGDTWIRLADIEQDSVASFLEAVDSAGSPVARDERLERIATVAMVAIIEKSPFAVTRVGDMEIPECTARGAVKYAKALIAELDKQA